jgi:hypothetical protein
MSNGIQKFQDVTAHFLRPRICMPAFQKWNFPMIDDHSEWLRHRASIPRLVIEHRYTRDAKVPLSAEDPEMDCGWRCVPIPPTDDERWQIFDTRGDRKTGWRRIRIVNRLAS